MKHTSVGSACASWGATSAFSHFLPTGRSERRHLHPHTPSTRDLPRISSQTRGFFPGWTQEITTIRGVEDWAVFEGSVAAPSLVPMRRATERRSQCTARRSSR